MGPESLPWLAVGHIYGFAMWVGTMFATFHVLKAHAAAPEGSQGFIPLERGAGIAMDIGAFIAIVFGVLLIVGPVGSAIFKQGGFFHVKLTLVAGLVVFHVLLRRGIRRNKTSSPAAPPSWLMPAMVLTVLGILVMIKVRPM